MVHIEIDHVSHSYGQGPLARPVLNDVCADLTERRIGVVGHNGSGKSTFVRMLNALLVPSQGVVRVNGMDTAKQAGKVRKLAGFLFTDPDNQIIMPTVREDVAFGLRRSGLTKQQVNERVDQALTRFGLESHGDHPAHLLSGGQGAGESVTEASAMAGQAKALLELGAQRVLLKAGHLAGYVATGAILTVKAMHELERSGGRRAIVTMCIGGVQGIALALERI